jgi:hypothetical protein
MMTVARNRWLTSISLVSVFFILSTPTQATPVTVTGGFTSFSGAVGAGGQFETLINGAVVCPNAGCQEIIGDLSLAFGSPVASVDFRNSTSGSANEPNLVMFTPAAPQDVILGQEFLLGTFTYRNGIWFTDPTFGFTLTTSSSDTSLDGQVFSDSLHLTITGNAASNTPEQNADFLSFVVRSDLGSVRGYELSDSPNGSNIVTADFYGRIGSLIPTRFANAQGGGFLDPSVGVLPAAEPGTLALLGIGIGIGVVGRSLKKKTRT